MAPQALTQDLLALLDAGQYRQLRAAFAEMNEVDIAQFMETLPAAQALLAFRTLPKDAEMEVFAELSPESQQHIIAAISDAQLAAIIDELMVDDAVDMLEEMPAYLVKRVLRSAAPETRALINQFLRYPEYSAGSIMTAEYVDLKQTMTVEDAIKRIRRTGQDRETIYTCYVVDDTRHLQGVVTVKDLLLAADSVPVGDIMQPPAIVVYTSTDQEETAKLLARYDLISLPVVDAENRLVGIVTVDDALDVIREEDTEDFEKMAAMTPSERPYLKTSVFTLAKNRFVWLLILMISGMLASAIMGRYQHIYVALPVLVTFVTMLNGTGGNAGSQSSTLIIRGMALGEIHTGDILRVAFKEARVAMVVAAGLGVVNYLRMLITSPGTGLLPLVVSLSLMAAVLVAKIIGGVLPIVAQACRVDPALMAAPLITTIVDAVVLIIYFNIAQWLLM